MLAVLPVLFIELPFRAVASRFLLIIVIAPIVEEYTKYFFVKQFIYKKTEFDEPIDGIVYAASVALGFAAVENAFYLFSYSTTSQFMTVFSIRAILSVPGHALFSSMWGYALGLAKFSESKRAKSLIRNGIILAMVTHALFNSLTFYTPLGGLGLLIFVAVMWIILHRRLARVLAVSPHAEREEEDISL